MIVDLTVKFAKENPSWGYDRISGALTNVGYNICDSTIGNILKAHGIEPAPDRKRTRSWELPETNSNTNISRLTG